MHAAYLLSTLLSLCTTLVVAQTPSGVPMCYTCPAQDSAGFPLGDHSIQGDGLLFCSYPAFPGENPNDFFCTYDPASGGVREDHDAGFCPGSAPQTGCASKRANLVRLMEARRRGRRAATPPVLDPGSPMFDEQVAKMKLAGRPWVEGDQS